LLPDACVQGNPVAQVALGAMVDRDLSEPYSMFTYRESLSFCTCAALLLFPSLSLPHHHLQYLTTHIQVFLLKHAPLFPTSVFAMTT
jgi:hypothetical protein